MPGVFRPERGCTCHNYLDTAFATRSTRPATEAEYVPTGADADTNISACSAVEMRSRVVYCDGQAHPCEDCISARAPWTGIGGATVLLPRTRRPHLAAVGRP